MDSGAAELYAGLVIVPTLIELVLGGPIAFFALSWIGFFAAGAITGAFFKDKVC